MKSTIKTDVDLNLMQAIRLVQALGESDYPIHVSSDELWKFDELQKRFPLTFASGQTGNPATLPEISLNHSIPLTSIGELKRPLLFPHSIPSWCRQQWQATPKDLFASFCGLITRSRRSILHQWLRGHYGIKTRIPLSSSFFSRVKSKIVGMTPAKNEILYMLPDGPFKLWSSTRGRVFPIKAWDEEYFRILLRSRFVLCPSGDFTWSYRFFESVLCGAIPIVEETCEAYSGFFFQTVHEKPCDWSEEIAQRNFELCLQRVTVPVQDLNLELSRLVGVA